MAWKIPEPDAVHWPAAPSWSGWWRALMLSCSAVVMTGCGVYFWLHDARALVYAFAGVVLLILLFAAVAGWWMYRYGVLLEHAEGTTQYNTMLEAQWQTWAQEGMVVPGVSTLFPEQVREPQDVGEPVSTPAPLRLPECPGAVYLFTELLIPLRVALQIFTCNQSLAVCLPEEASEEDWLCFRTVWSALSLPLSAIQLAEMKPESFSHQMTLWQQKSTVHTGWLIIRHNWTQGSEGTQGAVAWLLSHPDTRTGLRPCAMLHRLFPTDNTCPDGDLRQFLQYQCVSNTVKGVWSDAVTQLHISRLIVALSQRHKAVVAQGAATVTPPVSPVQQYLPHWLGETKEGETWFAVTQAIKMAEHTRETQVLALAKGSEAFLISVSSGGEYVA
ncbi:hypothetical protein [Pseudescherichia vulneris]|uniref:hypothetical protein n=1 Tax=Pseudescherichia vulneris TaxID=566 RepID=UPI0028ACF1A5|nr:hypothetical protein [Pseudescherichia vulneris]